jgi:5-hydroxyisourate hydrolase-like protein (transthyretin family)
MAAVLAFGAAPARAAGTCAISGVVTLEGGAPGAGIGIHLYQKVEGGWLGGPYGVADLLGTYSFTGLEAGSYAVEFYGASGGLAYARQYYSGKYGLADADLVTLAAGAARTDVNATLGLAGHITGTVSGASADPLAGIDVEAWHSTGSGGWDNLAQATTPADGSYDLGNLQAGVYRVRFKGVAGVYLEQFFHDKPDAATADDVIVTAGATTAGIDATLVAPGRLTGTVRNAAAAGLPGIHVDIYGPGGSSPLESALTAADGSYVFDGLWPGSYRLQFRDDSNAYFNQFYQDKPDLGTADPIIVVAGATTAGIDATLIAPSHIRGTVRSVGGAGLAAISVDAFRSDGVGDWVPVASAQTNVGGDYDLGGLKAGAYRVGFYDTSGSYVRQYYDDKATLDAAEDVVVGAGATAPGIDAALVAAGRITGKVSNAAAVGLADIHVYADRSNGSGGWGGSMTVHTNVDGTFAFHGLAAGIYRVSFADPLGLYVVQYYNNKPTPALADGITITSGATASNIDATLAAKVAVTSFTPTSGPVGAVVTVTGTGFSGATAVAFSGTAATSFSVASDTQFTATVPAAATTGTISVTAPGGTGTSATSFTVTLPAAPTISGFLPASGPVGTTVTLTGTGFSGATAVAFNGVAAAAFSVVSATQITATVPAAATTGPLTVTAPSGSATSATSFTVVFTPTVTLKLSGLKRGSLTLGKRVTAKGAVTPVSLAGSKVTLTVQRKKGVKWIAAKTAFATFRPTGAYSWKYKPAKTGSFRMQATIVATPAHTAATTKWAAFKVK